MDQADFPGDTIGYINFAPFLIGTPVIDTYQLKLAIPGIDHTDEGAKRQVGVCRRKSFGVEALANGERFDSEALTAAHPNLPFGSLVRVVNPRNGKFELVRINDRGPYQEGREIDVSYRVARKIGLIRSGVSQVRLELMA